MMGPLPTPTPLPQGVYDEYTANPEPTLTPEPSNTSEDSVTPVSSVSSEPTASDAPTVTQTPVAATNEPEADNASIVLLKSAAANPNSQMSAEGEASSDEGEDQDTGEASVEGETSNEAEPSAEGETKNSNNAQPSSNNAVSDGGNTQAADAKSLAKYAEEPAPKCTVDGCGHIGLDENCRIIALCPHGQWLLDAANAEHAALHGLSDAELPDRRFSLRKGENMLYRSGRYDLTGGESSALLYIREGTRCALTLHSTELLTLSIQSKAVVTLDFDGKNNIYTIAANGAALTLNGSGSLFVQNLNCRELYVLSGSMDLPSYTANLSGRAMYAFGAEGTSSATLDGKTIAYTQPCPDGTARLWLPQADAGYAAIIKDGVLVITSGK